MALHGVDDVVVVTADNAVLVLGTARVTIGDSVWMLRENESVYVPSGARHRLENPGKIDLELIEVRTGSYLAEDDIERIEDDYHRSLRRTSLPI